jgi:hypothetical protein
LGSARGDAELVRNDGVGNERPRQHELDEARQAGTPPPPAHLEQQPLARQHPAVVVPHALLGPRGDGAEDGQPAGQRVAHEPAVAGHASQGAGEGGQVVTGLVTGAQEIGGEQGSEPGAVLERLEGGPGINRDGGGEDRRQVAGVGGYLAPGGEAVGLAPGRIVDERRLLPRRAGVSEKATGAGDQGVDAGELGGEGVINVGEIPLPVRTVDRRCGWHRDRVLIACRIRILTQGGEARGAGGPAGLGGGDAAAGAQDGVGAGELLRGGVAVATGVVEDEILEEDEIALEGEAGAGVGEGGAGGPAVADGAGGEELIETSKSVLGGGQRRGEGGPGEWLEQAVNHCLSCISAPSRKRQGRSLRAHGWARDRSSDH